MKEALGIFGLVLVGLLVLSGAVACSTSKSCKAGSDAVWMIKRR